MSTTSFDTLLDYRTALKRKIKRNRGKEYSSSYLCIFPTRGALTDGRVLEHYLCIIP